MKARTKITLLTSSFATITALLFIAVVAYELMEQPLRLIDGEISEIGALILDDLQHRHSGTPPAEHESFTNYAITVYTDQQLTIFENQLGKEAAIGFRHNDNFFFAMIPIPLHRIRLNKIDLDEADDAEKDSVPFRVSCETVTLDSTNYLITIGRPTPILLAELKELALEIGIGLFICLLLTFIGGYYLSGTILRPLNQINNQVRMISESSLDLQLPLGKSRDELYTLSMSLNSMLDRLRHSFERQRELIGSGAHELQSPMTILMLGLEKLLADDPPANIRSVLEKQLHTVRRVTKLIRSLLLLSRLEQHDHFHPESINFGSLVKEMAGEFTELLEDRTIELHMEIDEFSVRGDREKLSQLLINLIDNAIKYNAPACGRIEIAVWKERDFAYLRITNTGQTIPTESQTRVFEQFYRIEKSRSSALGGAGLGLTIVKQIVELHQGSIIAATTSDGLAAFTVSLPLT